MATDIINKLKLKKEQPFFLLNAPAAYSSLFSHLPVRKSLSGHIAQVLLFVPDQQSLAAKAPSIIASLQNNALLWIAYPKKSGSIKTGISRDNGWSVLLEAGYEPVTLVSVDNDWSALRFKKKEDISGYIRAVPQQERVTEGIDYAARTVTPPADMLTAMEQYPGMAAFFDTMSFTHKKEYVMAVAEAKKPETRQRRIDKTIEMLQQKMDKK